MSNPNHQVYEIHIRRFCTFTHDADYEFTKALVERVRKVYIKLDKDGHRPSSRLMERSILKQLGLTQGMKVREGCSRGTAYCVSWYAAPTKHPSTTHFAVLRRFKHDSVESYEAVIIAKLIP